MRNHTQLVVFFQTEFHRGKKFTCKKDFFFSSHLRFLSQLHVNAL